MRLHATIACALICRAAALESVPADAFRSVARGRVAVVDDFLARDVVAALRGDAEELWDAGLYSAPTRDTKLKRRNERFVLRGSVWRDFGVCGGVPSLRLDCVDERAARSRRRSETPSTRAAPRGDVARFWPRELGEEPSRLGGGRPGATATLVALVDGVTGVARRSAAAPRGAASPRRWTK